VARIFEKDFKFKVLNIELSSACAELF